VQAAEDGLLAAQNLLAAQKEKLAGVQSRLHEAEAKREDLVANLQKATALAGGAMDEDDPPPKEGRGPLNSLDTAVLPHICTFLGQLLSGNGTPEELASLASTLRGKLGQHLPDPQQAAQQLLGKLPAPAAPAQDPNGVAAPPAVATTTVAANPAVKEEVPSAVAAADSLRHNNGPTEVSTPVLKKLATKRAKAAALRAEAATGLPPAETIAVSSGDDADDDDSDRDSAKRSRSPRDRERPPNTRGPHSPRSPTPEH
jgi:hypothetical protein